MKNNKGITLIALIITIIIMLILVAVTIAVAAKGRTFKNSTEAAEKTEEKAILETIISSAEANYGGYYDVAQIEASAISTLKVEYGNGVREYSTNPVVIEVPGKYGTFYFEITPTNIRQVDKPTIVESAFPELTQDQKTEIKAIDGAYDYDEFDEGESSDGVVYSTGTLDYYFIVETENLVIYAIENKTVNVTGWIVNIQYSENDNYEYYMLFHGGNSATMVGGSEAYGISNPADDTWYCLTPSTNGFVPYEGSAAPSSISISSGINCPSYYADLVASFSN